MMPISILLFLLRPASSSHKCSRSGSLFFDVSSVFVFHLFFNVSADATSFYLFTVSKLTTVAWNIDVL